MLGLAPQNIRDKVETDVVGVEARLECKVDMVSSMC